MTRQHTRTELRAFYAIVLGLALCGQSTGASSWLVPAGAGPFHATAMWVLVIAFVLVLELGAVVLLRRAETQRRAGERAWVAILAAIAIAAGAAVLSWIGHWGGSLADQIQAYAFAGATLLGVLVWAIMADLSIDPLVARHRAVEAAVRRYIKHLPMDAAEKAVLMATLDVPMVTLLITGGPDALEGADARNRNVRIAKILAVAIDPSTWHGDAKPSAAARPASKAPQERVPKPVEQPKSALSKPAPKPNLRASGDFTAVEEAIVRLWADTGRRPGARALEAAVDGVRKKSAIHSWMQSNPGRIDELSVRAEAVRTGRSVTDGASA